MGKGYIARGHRPTASGRSYESIDPKSTRRHGRSISAGSPGRVVGRSGQPHSRQQSAENRMQVAENPSLPFPLNTSSDK
jgi:hypothetical protein